MPCPSRACHCYVEAKYFTGVLPRILAGENLVNVSVYIKDAPYRHLRLLGRGLIHDWNWLLSNNLDYAEPLGDLVYWTGMLICCSSILAGIIFLVKGGDKTESIQPFSEFQ